MILSQLQVWGVTSKMGKKGEMIELIIMSLRTRIYIFFFSSLRSLLVFSSCFMYYYYYYNHLHALTHHHWYHRVYHSIHSLCKLEQNFTLLRIFKKITYRKKNPQTIFFPVLFFLIFSFFFFQKNNNEFSFCEKKEDSKKKFTLNNEKMNNISEKG